MDQAFVIIDMLHKQIPVDEIEKKIQWGDLTQADYEKLFSEADLLSGSRKGFDLLGLMYKAAKDQDYWIETRILAKVIARPESDIEKSKLLKRMGYCLEKIRESISRVPRLDPQQLRYRRYLCDYVFLSARLLEDAGNIDGAIKEYIAAQKAYSEYNFLAEAQQIDEPIARLQRLKRQGDQLISIQPLIDRKTQLENEISALISQAQEKTRLLEESDVQIKFKESQLLNLNLRVKELESNIETKGKDLQKIKSEAEDLESQRENSKAWLEQIEREKTTLVEEVISLREQAQSLDVRVAQTALKLNDRLAALQAQIDLKETELDKTNLLVKQGNDTCNELEKLIKLRRQELDSIEERLHHDEEHLIDLSNKRAQLEKELTTEPISKEPILEEPIDDSQVDLEAKLERYKKTLKASRARKTTKTNQATKDS